MIWILAVGATAYVALFLSLYEGRYDDEGVTAPGWLFRQKSHRWSDLISIKQSDDITYSLKFDDGTLRIRKFLAGMPTFRTFVTEVREINRRA
ncbi:MAG: hypothetical protein WBB25_20795 [Sulfitobacter sp.]